MNHAESKQRAYRWAYEVYNNPKGKMVERLCAKQMLDAIEDAQDNAELACAALIGLVREWVRIHTPGLERPIKTLSKMLNIDPSDVEAKAL